MVRGLSGMKVSTMRRMSSRGRLGDRALLVVAGDAMKMDRGRARPC